MLSSTQACLSKLTDTVILRCVFRVRTLKNADGICISSAAQWILITVANIKVQGMVNSIKTRRPEGLYGGSCLSIFWVHLSFVDLHVFQRFRLDLRKFS